jgi:hypothetical protein
LRKENDMNKEALQNATEEELAELAEWLAEEAYDRHED